MKIATVTPTRGDRPEFLKNALRLIKLQTRKPDEIIIVDDAPKSDAVDINYRYQKGCKNAVEKGCDIIFFWEDDDYYSPKYIEAMLRAYEKCSPRPLVFGAETTMYYNLLLRKYGVMYHPGRASAMNTLISSKVLNLFPWPEDSKDSDKLHGKGFLDRQLWNWAQKNKVGKTLSYRQNNPLSIGMKHGIGKCGGSHHDTKESEWLVPLKNNDKNLKWLREHIVQEVFPFYEKFAGNYKGI